MFFLPPSLRWSLKDILLMTPSLFISWISMKHRVWQWPSVQVDVSCLGYGHLQLFLFRGFFLIMVGGFSGCCPGYFFLYTHIYIYIKHFSFVLGFFQSTKCLLRQLWGHEKTLSRCIFSLQTCMQTHPSFDKFRPKPGGISLPCRVNCQDMNNESNPIPDLFILCPTVFSFFKLFNLLFLLF